MSKLQVLCAYQGGKQRIATQIVDRLLAAAGDDINHVHFFDVCCGSGAITIELINRGVDPQQITMLDKSSWGAFWKRIGTGTFDIEVFENMLKSIPANKRDVKKYMIYLANQPIEDNEAYIYPILQSCSFGGKQIWLENGVWRNAFFRDYWEPTSQSVRRSPANPMQPSPSTLLQRVTSIVEGCRGITCIQDDAMKLARHSLPSNSLVYIDPPYAKATKYGFELDIQSFTDEFLIHNSGPLFVSEAVPLSPRADQLSLHGANGGISGNRRQRNPEWLSRFGVSSLEETHKP